MRFETFACGATASVDGCALSGLRWAPPAVCGASVASRLFIDAAATPPHEEGNAPRLNNCRIRSQVHTPPLQTICWYRFFCYRPPGACRETFVSLTALTIA